MTGQKERLEIILLTEVFFCQKPRVTEEVDWGIIGNVKKEKIY